MIDPTIEAEVHRLFYVEGWPIGTIARQLRLHHNAVERVVHSPEEARPSPVRPMMIDTYRDFIMETLQRWPDLTASRLFDMCVDRGYRGAPSHFRALVRAMRPVRANKHEAFLRLRTMPGEEGQVDWAHFGRISVGRARRQLLAFVMVLSWSRMIYARFFIGAQMPSFLRGHVEAFRFFQGVPRTLKYDNLKSAVLERRGDAIRFHPTMLTLARFYRFNPQPVGVRRGNEKGRVERAIRFMRDSFYGGRTWKDLPDLNRQVQEWCEGRAASRPWPDDNDRTVESVFHEERPRLLDLPGDDFPCDDIVIVKIPKTPYARYDTNDYSVPPAYVRSSLTIKASEDRIRILKDYAIIAEHDRTYDKGKRVEIPEHLAELRKEKRAAKHGRTSDRLLNAVPSTDALFEVLAERGENIGSTAAHLMRLLDQFGGSALEAAVQTALERGTPHPRSVQMLLEAKEQMRNNRVLLPLDLPDDPRVRDASVRPHSLAAYDTLRGEGSPNASKSYGECRENVASEAPEPDGGKNKSCPHGAGIVDRDEEGKGHAE